MLNRAAFLVITGTLLWPAVAISSPTTRTISETQNIADVATVGKPHAGFRVVIAGALNGRIGAIPVHGALRAYDRSIGSNRETVRGTEFDARGSRSYVIHVHVKSHPNGRITSKGTGHWIGGTGAYAKAHGAFKTIGSGAIIKFVGTRPVGYLTIHLKGTITY